ncbi:MAG TPA: ABC transporter substrate-binding protein [Actinomycetota bacterium]
MSRKLRYVAVIAVLATFAAACGGNGDSDSATPGGDTGAEPVAGGTLRGAFDGGSDFFWAMNPTAEYYSVSWEFLRGGLARTLLSYNGKPAADGGNETLPDLAADQPVVSDDGLTYTFTLKDGIMFGDPLNREITADDFVTTFTRLAEPEAASGAGYQFYYSGVIEGFAEALDDEKVTEVSGVTAVDDKTLEIKLEKPLGAFPFLVAMPATAPLPAELVKTHPKDIGQFLVSSGPYQWEGMEGIDLGSDEPPTGMQVGKSYVLVRNPAWDQSTDDLRPAYLDRIEVQVGGEIQDLLDKVNKGSLDICFTCLGTATTLQQYHADPELEGRIRVDPSDGITYTGLNLFQAPMDDIHIRKAVNWVIDRAALLRLIGGPDQGEITSHFIPPAMLDGLGADYDPYGSPDNRGDLTKAQDEMKQSKYDTDQDGMCDAPECTFDALTVSDDDDAIKTLQTMAASMEQIGLKINIKTLQYSAVVQKCATMAAHQAFCQASWGKDFASAFTYFDPLLDGGENGSNYAFMGTTEEALKEAGYEVPADGIPSIADQIDECWALDLSEANQCWADLDKYVMEEVVPVVPRRFSNNIDILGAAIDNYSFDQFAGMGAIDHYSLVNGGA